MKHATAFTRCPRCGSTTRLPVITCPKCFYDATPPAITAPFLGYTALILIAIVLVGALAWQKYKTGASPLVGSWKSNRSTFNFASDGSLKADGYFDTNGRYHDVNKTLDQHWSILVGDLLTIDRIPTDGTNKKITARVQWTIDKEGKTLTLKGIGETDNMASEIKLSKQKE
jgi:hypothetical protein